MDDSPYWEHSPVVGVGVAAGGGLDARGLAGMLQCEVAGFDLGDILGMVTGGGDTGGAMSFLDKLKGLFARR